MKGMATVLANLNKEIGGIKGRTKAGLLAGGFVVLRDCKVPREYGNLLSSVYARKAQHNPNGVEVGFGAVYAAAVHEKIEEKLKGQKRKSGLGVYWGSDGESQFLLKSLRRNRDEIVAQVKKHARVGGT